MMMMLMMLMIVGGVGWLTMMNDIADGLMMVSL
jgi:hypothetical protein